MRTYLKWNGILVFSLFIMVNWVFAQSEELKNNIYNPGKLKPRDSILKVKAGQPAPDFALPAVSGKKITLSQYRGKRISRQKKCGNFICAGGIHTGLLGPMAGV
jgi:hypothetical protein